MQEKEILDRKDIIKLVITLLGIIFVIIIVGLILESQKQVVDLQNQIQTIQDNKETEIQNLKDQTTIAKKAAQQAENAAKSASKDDTSIVDEWSENIAHIACTNDNVNYSLGSGTITTMDFNNEYQGPVIMTNAHVVTYQSDNSTYVYSTCTFKRTGDSTLYWLDPNTFTYSPSQDVEWIPVKSSLYPNSNFKSQIINVCKSAGKIGESLIILGYPENGGTGGTITATDGIVSSYDGQYYVTSAKVDHGNSGGAAILKDRNCYLGIPTWADTGQIESYARILDYSYIITVN